MSEQYEEGGTVSSKRFLCIPVRKWRSRAGVFTFANAARLASARAVDALPLAQLRDELAVAGVLRVRAVVAAAGPAALQIRRAPTVSHPEGYRLDITPEGICLTTRTDAGAYYGIQTLRDLIRLHGRTLPAVQIDDEPDFRRRGIYYDCARGKMPTVATLKSLVERLAHWKINELQLYIENGFAVHQHPTIGRGFDPFTPADIAELQAFCGAHHVRFVGSMASLGHMELVLSNPRYTHLGELPGMQGYAGGTTLCPTDPGSVRLLRDLYDEYIPLFEAEDFNACGDEPWELGKGRSQAVAARVGVGRLYLDFMRQVHALCVAQGKRTNLWADIVLEHPDLLGMWPNEIVMLNWGYDARSRSIKQTRIIAEAGLPFMVCSGTNGWASHGTRLRMAIDNVSAFSAEARRYGAEGILHTDWGDGGHRNLLAVSLCSFAHAAAHAWHGRGVDDANFPRIFCRNYFGQRDDRLADNLEAMGGICDTVGSYGGLYFSLRCSMGKRRRRKLLRVDHGFGPGEAVLPSLSSDRLEAAIALLEPLRVGSAWPELPPWADAFDRLAMDVFRLAVEQDYAACRRLLLANHLREGRPPPASAWLALDTMLDGLGTRFDRLWLAQNRPSRLHENQFLLALARKECRALAGL